jgi:P-type Ca2+ transporter type 2A
MEAPWTKSAEQVLQHFVVDSSRGLSSAQAAKHAELYGKNGQYASFHFYEHNLKLTPANQLELPEEPPTPLWELILEQFKDQLVLILLASAVISFVLAIFEDSEDATLLGAFVEPAVILLILIANAAVGVIQETNAEKAIDVRVPILSAEQSVHMLSQALKEYSPDEAKVLRSSQLARIHASELVPGDIISVAVGDRIPADCRLISVSSSSFRVDQAILTGESVSVSKSEETVLDERAVKQDMTNILFSV